MGIDKERNGLLHLESINFIPCQKFILVTLVMLLTVQSWFQRLTRLIVMFGIKDFLIFLFLNEIVPRLCLSPLNCLIAIFLLHPIKLVCHFPQKRSSSCVPFQFVHMDIWVLFTLPHTMVLSVFSPSLITIPDSHGHI